METKLQDRKDYKKPRAISQGVKIKIEDKDLSAATELGLNITGVTANGILYLPLPQFTEKYKVSYSTLCRNIEKLRFHRNAWNYFIKIGNKNYVSCGIIANRKKHTGHFSNLEYAEWLRCFHWDLIGSVSYSDSYSELAARKSMEKLFKRIRRQYYNKELVFFFVSEPNPAGTGWHNHFLLGFQGEIQYSEAKNLIENTLRADNSVNQSLRKANSNSNGATDNVNQFGIRSITKLEPFQTNEYFIGYVVKKINIAKDGYDFLSNNLLN
jgi:hypothetical protein